MSNRNDGNASKSADQIAAETYQALRDSLTVVEDVLILAHQGLERNPSPDERRDLNGQILDLQEQRTRIDGKMTALIAHGTALSPPTHAQLAEIAALTGRVEQQKNQAVAASMTVALGTDVLAFAKRAAFA
jgi:hypothetical protein